MIRRPPISVFFNDTTTTEIYTLSLHAALPIYDAGVPGRRSDGCVSEGLESTAVGQFPVLHGGPPYPACRFPCQDRKSTRLNSSHANISHAVFCLKKK